MVRRVFGGVEAPVAEPADVREVCRRLLHAGHPRIVDERQGSAVLAAGYRTGDIFQPGMRRVGTEEMGDAVITALRERKAA